MLIDLSIVNDSRLPEDILDMIDEEDDEDEADAVALAIATLWKSSNKSHVWRRTLLADAAMTSIL